MQRLKRTGFPYPLSEQVCSTRCGFDILNYKTDLHPTQDVDEKDAHSLLWSQGGHFGSDIDV
jgi:hypothetical protein